MLIYPFLNWSGRLDNSLLEQFAGVLVVLALLAAPFLLLVVALVRQLRRRRADSVSPHRLDRSLTRRALLGLVAGEATCFMYGLWVEPDWVEVTHHWVETPKLPRNLPPLRIVQLTDLHVERWGKREAGLAALVKAQHPDLLLLTGDYANGPARAGLVDDILADLSPRLGTWAVFGNWESPRNYSFYFKGSRVTLLDRSVQDLPLSRSGAGIQLGGVHFYDAQALPQVCRAFDPKRFSILLHHTPDAMLSLGSRPPDLLLTGHTHGGQVRVPFYGAVVTLTQVGKRYEAGRYRVGDTTLYVSRGIGMEGGPFPRVRFLCRPEIPVFDIVGTGPATPA